MDIGIAKTREEIEVHLDKGTQPVPALSAVLAGKDVLAVLEGCHG